MTAHCVVHYIDSGAFGGTENSLLTLLSGLDRHRWRPVLISHDEGGLSRLWEGARQIGVEVRLLPRMGQRWSVAGMRAIAAHLRSERVSIFHAHLNWPLACKNGVAAAIITGVPAIVVTEQLFIDPPRWRGKWAQRVLSLGVDRYIAVSNNIARRLRDSLRLPGEKLRVVRNGIPIVGRVRPRDDCLRKRLSSGANRPLVLTIARLHEHKGLKYLLEAATMVPDAVFVLAGEGPDRVALEAQARALGLTNRIAFLGFRADISDLLAACDLFVLPSLVEGTPLSVMEAAAAERPVVATEIGGTNELVSHGVTGLLVPPRDPRALAEAMQTVLTDRTLADRFAAAGRARALQEFQGDHMVRRVSEIYSEVLASRATHGH